MKSLAIISSYNELCGNATYTFALRKEFVKHYAVDVIGLKTRLLRLTHRKMAFLGDAFIDDIARQLPDYDYVNIQFEAGLYGGTPKTVLGRVKKLIDAAPNLVFTMHRVDLKTTSTVRGIYQKVHSLRSLRILKEWYRDCIYDRLTDRVIRHLRRRAKKKNVWLVVHTQWDREVIVGKYSFEHVIAYPVTFLHPEEIHRYRVAADVDAFKAKYDLPRDAKTIGVFGFLGEYKGFETVIEALRVLPNDYHVMVFGGQHPLAIREHVAIDPCVHQLLECARRFPQWSRGYPVVAKNQKMLPIIRRVHFLGNVDDESFINALCCCDRVVLPYKETGQSMSGIAALAIETRAKALFARNRSTMELQRFAPNCFPTFDIGNYIELGQKILTYSMDYSAAIDRYASQYNLVDNILMHKALFDGRNPTLSQAMGGDPPDWAPPSAKKPRTLEPALINPPLAEK